MRTQSSAVLRFSALFAFLFLSASGIFAQSPTPESRITQAVDNANLALLKGNVHPLARPEFDRGAAPFSLPMDRMTLVLRRSSDQEAALSALLDDQQNQSSPNYHKWLTPVQFGEQFGASLQDIQTITSWLQSQGFQVNHVANGRGSIEFSGTAGQVQQAFHTAIHKYSVPTATGNEDHWANSTDPQIPTALAPVVVGIATLHNFLKTPQHILSTEKFPFEHKPGTSPEFSGTSNGTPVHALAPGDLAIIYNATPLYGATPAVNGSGSTIAVVARSNINIFDDGDFRNAFAISGPEPQIVLNGTDPGDLGGDEEVEAVLDISYSAALAQAANVNFVVSGSTNSADGVDLSEMYIIDNNLGDVMTESFGGCEEGLTVAEGTSISNLAEQAAAQGITYMVSTGDNGSAGCDDPSSAVATQGVSVNVLASTPYTVGVGGTMFNEGANAATYWNATNNSVLASAKSYIPEDVWNESCSVASCGSADANLAAGSGGVSTLFAKPSWQSGVAGIPATGDRNLPDVSLTAAGHDPYLICLDGSCEAAQPFFHGVGGTSASVQAFGGIMALVRQKIAARVGQADYVFYKLAATETLANCNGSQATPVPSTNCIFYDTTVGNNLVPGITSGDYPSTVGYDRASGLGSVNITNLVNQWSTATFSPSITTLTVNPTTFTHGASATINITVAPKTGAPSFVNEDVSLLSSAGSAISDFSLSSTGTVSTATNTIPGGQTTVTAHYPGDGTLGASDSTPISVTVAPEHSTTALSITNGSGTAFTGGNYGTPVTLSSAVTGSSGFGIPSGLLDFEDNGTAVFSRFLDSSGDATPGPGTYFPTVGMHSALASYEGDPSFSASASAATSFTISVATTTISVQSSQPTIAPGASITLTANLVTTSQAPSIPGGSVTFFSGSTQLGNSFVNASSTMSATASLVTTSLPTGTDSITVKYSGDPDFAASTSPAITVNVTLQPDFTLAFAPAAVSVSSPGLTASTMLTVTGSNGFSGATTFSCAGLPSESSCSFLPPTVTGSGTTTVTISTTAPSSVPPATRNDFGNWQTAANPLRALALCFGLFVFVMQVRRRRLNIASGGVAVMFLIALAACGGGGGGVGTTPPANPGTPTVQNQTITVTATSPATATAAAITHTTTFTLSVN
jgi:hypothetical protein